MKNSTKTLSSISASIILGAAALTFVAGGATAGSLSRTCNSDAVSAWNIDLLLVITWTVTHDYCNDADMTAVETAVNDNYNRILGNDGDISNLDGRVTVNEGDIVALDGRVTTNEGDIASNLAAIGANEARITTNETNIATNTTNIAVNAADIAALRGGLSSGLAMSNAMEVFLPDPGAQYRLTAGVGYHDGETAYGVTGAGRISGGTALYFGVATDSAFDTIAGKAGISWQW